MIPKFQFVGNQYKKGERLFLGAGITAVVIIVLLIFIIVIFVGLNLFQKKKVVTTQNQPAVNQQPQEQNESYGGYGFKKPFYEKGGASLQHYWPGEASFSNEETEILLLNESKSNVEVKSFDLNYSLEGKTYPHKSSTWEKFPSITSWDKIEYLNISPQYYKGEPLVLNPNQKGKLHWHIQFGEKPLEGHQAVKIKLTLLKDGKNINIDEEFNRDSGTVFSKENH